MGTKMKGLLKGLRYISQIFDEDKEPEMQIGFPTDVKHVAHIGWDGPSVDNSPSWMKGFNSAQGVQSAPLNANGEPQGNPEVKWVSQDSTRRGSKSQNSPTKDLPEMPKSSRRHALPDGSSTSGSPRREPSSKSRRSPSDSSKPTRKPKDWGPGSESPSQGLPDIPKKTRRKKSKESVRGEGSSRSSRSKAIPPPIAYTSPFSDPGPESIPGSNSSQLSHTSSLRPIVKEGDKGRNGIS